MSSTQTPHPADERMLDAALEQILRGQLAGKRGDAPALLPAADFEDLPAVGRASRWSWSHAALFLLGLGVTCLLFWGQRGGRVVPLQDPVTYGPVQKAEGREEIEALPDDIMNLTCGVLKAGDLELLTRFQSLRRLQVSALDLRLGKIKLKTKHKSWVGPAAAIFEPLAKLPLLESLTMPMRVDLTAEHLVPLQKCAKLRELQLMGDRISFSEAFVAALRKLPHLTSLRFDLLPMDAAAFARCRSLQLEELHLSRSPDLNAAGFEQVCAMASLRRLSFEGWGTRDFYTKDKKSNFWQPSPGQLRNLAKLPRLEHVSLHSCLVGGKELAELPKELKSLELWATELVAEDYKLLRRFASLQRLKLRPARQTFTFAPRDTKVQQQAMANTIAESISRLHLREVYFTGLVTDVLLQRLAQQPELVDLTLMSGWLPAVPQLAKSPRLESLHLIETYEPGRLTVDGLHELSKCEALTMLELGGTIALPEAELREALGDRVRLQLAPFR